MLPPRLPISPTDAEPPSRSDSLRSSPEEASSAGSSFVGLRVVAKWSSNGYFYSGRIIKDAGEGRFRLRFDDGYECEVAGKDILLCDPIPLETEVTALLEDEYFSIGEEEEAEGQGLKRPLSSVVTTAILLEYFSVSFVHKYLQDVHKRRQVSFSQESCLSSRHVQGLHQDHGGTSGCFKFPGSLDQFVQLPPGFSAVLNLLGFVFFVLLSHFGSLWPHFHCSPAFLWKQHTRGWKQGELQTCLLCIVIVRMP